MNDAEKKAHAGAVGFVDGPISRSEKREAFRKDLASVLNKHSMENGSNTPDYMLADYLIKCLHALDATLNERTRWHEPNTPQRPDEVA